MVTFEKGRLNLAEKEERNEIGVSAHRRSLSGCDRKRKVVHLKFDGETRPSAKTLRLKFF